MGVYIKNMEMPKEGFAEILVRADGTVQQTGQSYRIDGTDYYTPYVGEMPTIYKAVPVPPHGRLGDLDELYDSLKKWLIQNRHSMTKATMVWVRGVLEGIAAAPTIIDAEEGET